MSNTFIKGFIKEKTENYALEEQVVFFSQQLQRALGIKDDMLQAMNSQNYSMNIGKINLTDSASTEIVLKVENRCFTDGWIVIIEATPVNSINMEASPLWNVLGGGTGIARLPNEETQKLILELIKTL